MPPRDRTSRAAPLVLVAVPSTAPDAAARRALAARELLGLAGLIDGAGEVPQLQDATTGCTMPRGSTLRQRRSRRGG